MAHDIHGKSPGIPVLPVLNGEHKMRKHSFTIWSIIFFLPAFIFIICPAIYIFLVDPLWQWDHPWHLARWHRPFNERIQKTNYLASHKVNIDTLIVGSSRSSYINPKWLGTENGFNYAVSSGKPSEFATHISYVKKRSRIPLKLVVIESSFGHALTVDTTFEEPQKYIDDAEDWIKKYKNLFSRDTYKLAKNSRRSPQYNYYLYEGGALHSYRYPYRKYEDDNAKHKVIEYDIKTYRENAYNRDYDESFAKYLSDIHKALGDTNFIVYTTPVSKPMMQLLYDMGRMEAYERWLRELVTEFGVVYHFMYPNGITMDLTNFNDAHHPTKETSAEIMNIIQTFKHERTRENEAYCGIVLTASNIDEEITRFRKQFKTLRQH